MPLGVEHEYPGTQLYFPFEIPKPLMPLGVEHKGTLIEANANKEKFLNL